VTQVPLLARYPQAADRPSHTWTSTQYSAPYQTTAYSMTKIMLCGMSDKKVEELLPLAKSWLRAPQLTIDSELYINHGYDQTQRAYLLTCKKPGKPLPVEVKLLASENSPVLNPALIINSWGDAGAKLRIDDKAILRGKNFRLGYRKRIDGMDLIVWIKKESTCPLRIKLIPFSD
jgi:hypothetical protein